MVWIVHSAVILQELPSFLLQIVYLADKTSYYYQGCSANSKGVGTHPKDSHFKTASNYILKQNVKKVWEHRSHVFPPHYTPDHY